MPTREIVKYLAPFPAVPLIQLRSAAFGDLCASQAVLYKLLRAMGCPATASTDDLTVYSRMERLWGDAYDLLCRDQFWDSVAPEMESEILGCLVLLIKYWRFESPGEMRILDFLS